MGGKSCLSQVRHVACLLSALENKERISLPLLTLRDGFLFPMQVRAEVAEMPAREPQVETQSAHNLEKKFLYCSQTTCLKIGLGLGKSCPSSELKQITEETLTA